MFIVAGLGNPGPKYADTRHNVGFVLVDALATQANASAWKSEGKSLTSRISLGGQTVLLAKPQTFMNLSGEALLALMTFYKVIPQHVIVIIDEIYLPTGSVRIRQGGSAGGHNGLKSLIGLVGQDFVRIRIGVGPCPEGWDLADFVLGRYGDTDKKVFASIASTMADMVTTGITQGWEKAGNLYNRRVA
jgi:peptidyl-tRNA hydrolase, PTH1 family